MSYLYAAFYIIIYIVCVFFFSFSHEKYPNLIQAMQHGLDTISIDSKLCTNKKEMANEFNKYFATI